MHCKCLNCAHKMFIYCVTPLARKKYHAGSCMNVSLISLCETERSYSKKKQKKTQQNPSCLTEMHTNTAIIGGRKLESVAVANSLVQWNKALCCYVKVSACNCSGCFEGFIIYIFLCFSKGALLGCRPCREMGGGVVVAERCLTKALYHNRGFNHCPRSSSGQA